MPILRSPTYLNPKMFPAGYSGSQVLRSYLGSSRLHPAGDRGTFGYSRLLSTLRGVRGTNLAVDLGAQLTVIGRATSNLNGAIGTHLPYDLAACIGGHHPAYLNGVISGLIVCNMQASVGGHTPSNFYAYVYVKQHSSSDIFSAVRGWGISDITGSIGGVVCNSLLANINSVGYSNLQAYLKVWPQSSLSASLYSYAISTIQAAIAVNYSNDLYSNIVGGRFYYSLLGFIKGQVIGESKDLYASTVGVSYHDLYSSIRSLRFNDLGSNVLAVGPKDLFGNVHGWGSSDLNSTITGDMFDGALYAYINSHGGFLRLNATIGGFRGVGAYNDLLSAVASYLSSDLNSTINSVTYVDLAALINSYGGSENLNASIFPKAIRLSALIPIITMSHFDLTSTINIRCPNSGSNYSDLSSYIRSVYFKDLTSTIVGSYLYNNSLTLGASIGLPPAKVINKLPINLTLKELSRVVNALNIKFTLASGLYYLQSSITGILRSQDMYASIYPVMLEDYNYNYDDSIVKSESVYTLDHYGRVIDRKDLEIYFTNYIRDYFYVSGNNQIFKTYDYERWKLNVSSYIPTHYFLYNTDLYRVERKFNKLLNLYNMSSFGSLDEAIRFAIEYVTAINSSSLTSYLNISGAFASLTSTINVHIVEQEVKSYLPASITGTLGGAIVSYQDDGVDIF